MIPKIPGFAIKDEIFGTTRAIYYRGIEEGSDQQLMLKSLRANFSNAIEVGRLRNEFELASKLDHPGINKYLNFKHIGNHYFIEMAYFQGIPLRNFLKSRPLQINEILDLAIQWVDIISQIHQNGLIHKNVHPDTLLINPSNNKIQLFDFSLTSSLKHERQLRILPQVLEGQLTHISPEQTGRMNRDLDYRTDYYSLGISLYELFLGRPPFIYNDPLEQVHAHIAREPEPLSSIIPTIPEVISDIILKLLAKIPEERYQSIHGLKSDLQRCAELLRKNEKLVPFTLASQDFSDQFQIPAKLYGREEEVKKLIDTFFEMASKGNRECIWVTGEAGIGKTVYVKEVLKKISYAKGNFISGKFDLLGRTTLFGGFIQAFSNLMEQIVAGSPEELNYWNRVISKALGQNGKILTDLIPGLEWIIGKQMEPTHLQGEEATRRFERLFLSFLKAVANKQHPLVLFLDDLQWADSGSLQLMELILLEPDLRHLLLIGSYRPNEVGELHPLNWVRQKIESKTQSQEIVLKPLAEHHLNKIVANTLSVEETEVKDLAKMVFLKTRGNPFFINQFLLSLHEEKLIHFNNKQRQWEWGLKEIQKKDITDNVVDLLIEKINRLPQASQNLLQIAACIGSTFKIDTLYHLAGKEQLVHLWEALIEGLIMPLDENYRMILALEEEVLDQLDSEENHSIAVFQFLHDRVQQAAYSMLPVLEKEAVHLKIGRMLLQQGSEIYEICNHLNIAKELIEDESEKNQLASLNWEAAVKAKSANAYEMALQYLAAGIELLPQNHWVNNYSLSIRLFTEKAVCLYLQGKTKEADQLMQMLSKKANSKLEKLEIYQVHVNLLTQAENHAEVFKIGRLALRLFNIRLPEKKQNLQLSIFKELMIAQIRLIGRKPENLIDHKFIRDQEKIKLMEFVIGMIPSAFQSNQDVFAFLILKILNITLKFGNNEASPLSYVGYGIILNSAFGNYATALKFGDLSLELNERLGLPIPTGRLLYPYHNFIEHPVKEIRSKHNTWKDLFQLSSEQGDPHFAGYALVTEIWNGSALGLNLERLFNLGNTSLEFLNANNNFNSTDMLLARFQALLVLMEKPMQSWRLDEEPIELWQKFDILVEEEAYTTAAVLIISLLQIHYLLPSEDASKWIEISEKYASYLGSLYAYTDLAMYQCLLISSVYSDASPSQKRSYRKYVKRKKKTMKKLANSSPANYRAHYLIIDGVYTQIIESEDQAITKMEEAAIFAEQHQYVQIKAHAFEYLGMYHFQKKNTKIAQFYLQESLFAYNQWGASAKVKQLQSDFPSLGLKVTYGTSEVSNKRNLDISTLIKASLSISEEIILDRLLKKMMRIVLENAGAEKGFFVDNVQGELQIKAADTLKGDLKDHKMAESIIRYVWHSREPVLINQAVTDPKFSTDPYILQNHPKSILCTPILTHGSMLGVLYLENNLTTNAFTPARLETLKILTSQIAISLENATLYKDLNDSLEQQRSLADAYSRFTPREFLTLLGKDSILDVELGDRRHGTMSVLFSDIRSYTTLVEKMTLEDNFEFVNSYASKMTEVISGNNGVVKQFLGDGIMAFFGNSKDALNACQAMQKALNAYNQDRLSKNREPIRVGMGVHTGPLIIGIIGTQDRMDQAMISDTVNTAARLEGLTKFFHSRLVISQQVLDNLDNKHDFHYRYLGKVKVKGKEEILQVYDVFGIDPPEIFDKKLATQYDFETGLEKYMNKDFSSAISHFEKVLQQFPEDLTCKNYLENAISMLDNPPSKNWNGSIKMKIK